MKRLFITFLSSAFGLLPLVTLGASAQVFTSPDKQLKIEISDNGGLAFSVTDGSSLLISKTNIGMDLQTSTGTINVSKASIVGKPTQKTVKEDITAPLYRQAKYTTT